MKDQTTEILILTLRVSAVVASVAILLWMFMPEIRAQVSGFLLGLAFSALNGWYLAAKTKQVIAIATANTGKRASLGFFTRVTLSILAVGIAFKKENFDLIFTIVGLVFVNFALVIIGIIIISKHNKQLEAKGVNKEDA